MVGKLKINNIEAVEVTEFRIGFDDREKGVRYYELSDEDKEALLQALSGGGKGNEY